MNMDAGEKADEGVLPEKRPNKGSVLPAEAVEGRTSPEGNSRQAAAVRTQSRGAASIRSAAVRWARPNRSPSDVRPEGGARCVSSARPDLRGGSGVPRFPTASIPPLAVGA